MKQELTTPNLVWLGLLAEPELRYLVCSNRNQEVVCDPSIDNSKVSLICLMPIFMGMT